jgi:hypothetical protein
MWFLLGKKKISDDACDSRKIADDAIIRPSLARGNIEHPGCGTAMHIGWSVISGRKTGKLYKIALYLCRECGARFDGPDKEELE